MIIYLAGNPAGSIGGVKTNDHPLFKANRLFSYSFQTRFLNHIDRVTSIEQGGASNDNISGDLVRG